MGFVRYASKPIGVVLMALLATTGFSAAAVAHLGETGHIHHPSGDTTASGAVWCIRFTEDPGVWQPDGETSLEASVLGDSRIVFVDCSEIVSDGFAVDARGEDGQHLWTVVPGTELGGEEIDDVIDQPSEETALITVGEWTKHQRRWLQKGDRLAAQLDRARTLQQARRGLANLQRHFKSETKWLRKHADRFEPESCLAEDMAKWKKRVRQAQRSLDKAIGAANRGNFAGFISQSRQFGRAYTKIEQIYNIGMCDV
jgi:hypothetical protein